MKGGRVVGEKGEGCKQREGEFHKIPPLTFHKILKNIVSRYPWFLPHLHPIFFPFSLISCLKTAGD